MRSCPVEIEAEVIEAKVLTEIEVKVEIKVASAKPRGAISRDIETGVKVFTALIRGAQYQGRFATIA